MTFTYSEWHEARKRKGAESKDPAPVLPVAAAV